MFDSIEVFRKQFTPIDGGYLYFPSRRSGGKLVTSDEYEALVDRWQRVAGHGGTWKTVAVVFFLIVIWTVAANGLELPGWVATTFNAALVVGICGWILWASFAPRRLVKGRPDIVPPRPLAESRKEARALLTWPFIFFSLVLCALALAGGLAEPHRTPLNWVWLTGSGLMFTMYVWIALRKLFDKKA